MQQRIVSSWICSRLKFILKNKLFCAGSYPREANNFFAMVVEDSVQRGSLLSPPIRKACGRFQSSAIKIISAALRIVENSLIKRKDDFNEICGRHSEHA